MHKQNRSQISRQTFPQMFDDTVLVNGYRPCQLWKNGPESAVCWTYDQVGGIVKEMAGGLMKLGIDRQDRVAIMSATCPQWLWSDFSILNCGAITVALYPTLSQREMASIINDSGTRIMYIQDEAMLSKVLQVWDELSSLEAVVVMGDTLSSKDPRVISLKELRDLGVHFNRSQPFAYERRWRSVDLFDPMTIIYTSGTTGYYKGAVHTHFSMNAACNLNLKAMPELSEKDVFLSFLPLSHSYERQCGQMMALSVGAAIAYAQKPSTILEDMQTFDPTVFMSTPSYFENIFRSIKEALAVGEAGLKAFDKALEIGLTVIDARADKNGFIDMSEGIDFTSGLKPELARKYLRAEDDVFSKARALLGSRYRFSFCAAGGLSSELCRLYLAMSIRIIEGYGLIETCNTVALNRLEKLLPGSVGPLASGVEGIIIQDGEWLVRGDSVIKQYWNNQEAEREAFTAEGFFKTGDIVQELPDGYIRIVERAKARLILNSGEKVPAARIESPFAMNQYIEQVFAIGDDKPFITALIVPRFDVFVELFREKGVLYEESALLYIGEGTERTCVKVGPDFVSNELLAAIINEEIANVNTRFEEHERIIRYMIINRRFTESADEITPTLKPKRTVIYSNFAAEIEHLYEQN